MSERMSEERLKHIKDRYDHYGEAAVGAGELLAEIDALRAELAKAERERDSARADGAHEILDSLKKAHLSAEPHVKAGYAAAIIAATAFVQLSTRRAGRGGSVSDLIKELKALKEKATPGPWEIFADGDLTEITAREKAAVIHWSGFDDSHRDLSGHRSNAALIVALVNHLPTILAKLEEGERMREALDGLIDAVTKEVNSPDHRGGSGFLLARLSDTRRALAGSAT